MGAGKTAYCGKGTGDGSTPSVVEAVSYTRNAIYDTSGSWSTPGFYGSGPKQGFISTAASKPLNEAAVEDSAGTINVVDGLAGGSTPGDNSACSPSSLIRLISEKMTDHFKDSETTKPAYRHFQGFNALFGDGHVKWRRYGSTKPGEWSIQADD